jgi:hypothetical protein
MFLKFVIVLEGATADRVSQFIVQLKPIFKKNINCD